MSILGCFDAAKEMTLSGTARGVTLIGNTREGRIEVSTGLYAPGRIIPSKQNAERALRYIDQALDQNLRVLAGVTYSGQDQAEDPIGTRHFITIIGRSSEATGKDLLFGLIKSPQRIVYHYYDPGFGQMRADNGALGKLFVDEATGVLFKPGMPRAAGLMGDDYEVTHVRVYRRPEVPNQ